MAESELTLKCIYNLCSTITVLCCFPPLKCNRGLAQMLRSGISGVPGTAGLATRHSLSEFLKTLDQKKKKKYHLGSLQPGNLGLSYFFFFILLFSSPYIPPYTLFQLCCPRPWVLSLFYFLAQSLYSPSFTPRTVSLLSVYECVLPYCCRALTVEENTRSNLFSIWSVLTVNPSFSLWFSKKLLILTEFSDQMWDVFALYINSFFLSSNLEH